MTHLLFEVTAQDFWIHAGAALLLLGVAVLACVLPAWRALRISPLEALRAET